MSGVKFASNEDSQAGPVHPLLVLPLSTCAVVSGLSTQHITETSQMWHVAVEDVVTGAGLSLLPMTLSNFLVAHAAGRLRTKGAERVAGA